MFKKILLFLKLYVIFVYIFYIHILYLYNIYNIFIIWYYDIYDIKYLIYYYYVIIYILVFFQVISYKWIAMFTYHQLPSFLLILIYIVRDILFFFLFIVTFNFQFMLNFKNKKFLIVVLIIGIIKFYCCIYAFVYISVYDCHFSIKIIWI